MQVIVAVINYSLDLTISLVRINPFRYLLLNLLISSYSQINKILSSRYLLLLWNKSNFQKKVCYKARIPFFKWLSMKLKLNQSRASTQSITLILLVKYHLAQCVECFNLLFKKKLLQIKKRFLQPNQVRKFISLSIKTL